MAQCALPILSQGTLILSPKLNVQVIYIWRFGQFCRQAKALNVLMNGKVCPYKEAVYGEGGGNN